MTAIQLIAGSEFNLCNITYVAGEGQCSSSEHVRRPGGGRASIQLQFLFNPLGW